MKFNEPTPSLPPSDASASDDAAANLRALRAPFPYLAERVYLDTAAAGLCWQGHGEAVGRFHDEVKSRGIDAQPHWQAMTRTVKNRLATWLGARPEDLTFTANTTEALNLAAHSLRFRPGDRIVMAADEFPSVARCWAPAVRAGAVVVRVPIEREADREAALLAALNGSTRVLAVSQTHWETGTTLDLARLGAACRDHDALLLVDGIQALGAVPTDVSVVDIYAASFFKWMLSGFGIGLLITSARARAAMEPAYGGYANIEDPAQLQNAHVNIPAIYGLDGTLDFFDGIGWPTVYRRVQALGGHLMHGAARHRLDLITPPSRRAGLFVVRCPDGEAARRTLAAGGVSVSARGAGLRISPHFYNTTDEIDRCLALVAALPN